MISFIAPLYNQAEFIRAWCEFTTSVSDDVIAIDTGCTDATFDIISEYPIKVLPPHIVKCKYTWDEGVIRNKLTDAAKYDWIFWLDGDELLGDEFREAMADLETTPAHFIAFQHYPFWLSPNLIRIKQIRKIHWWKHFHPVKRVKMYRKCPEVRWQLSGDHAPLELYGLGRFSPRLSCRRVSIPFFHYHHCIGRVGLHNRAEDYDRNGIKTITYFGSHPREVEYYDWWDKSLLFPSRTKIWETLHD